MVEYFQIEIGSLTEAPAALCAEFEGVVECRRLASFSVFSCPPARDVCVFRVELCGGEGRRCARARKRDRAWQLLCVESFRVSKGRSPYCY